MATAIVVSAVLFGLSHLPALAAQAELTAGLVARTVVLDALGGVAFGVLFWRRHLEAAMVAHATTPVITVSPSAASAAVPPRRRR